MSPSRRRIVVGAVCALVVGGGAAAVVLDRASSHLTTGSQPETATTGTLAGTSTEAPPYALAPTRRCLASQGFTVAEIDSRDPRLRALGDLAQRTSLAARRRSHTLGLAFGDAPLLLSLLEVPDDPYRLEVRRNALLMYKPAARAEAEALRRCLTP